MLQKLKRTPKCVTCGASLTGARVVIEGRWICPVCAYKLEFPDADVASVRQPRARKQTETLFDPGPPRKRASDG